MSLAILPDIGVIAREYLKDQAELVALFKTMSPNASGPRVYPDMPKNAVFPFIRLFRVGGNLAYQQPAWLDGGRFQLEAWAGTAEQAQLVAATAHAALMVMRGSFDEGFVTGVRETLGFQYLPDPKTGKARVLAEFAIYAHP